MNCSSHPRRSNAHKWINYILRPEVHASLSNKVFYASPNLAAQKFLKANIASNKTIVLSPAAINTMVPPETISLATKRIRTRLYTNFKAAK